MLLRVGDGRRWIYRVNRNPKNNQLIICNFKKSPSSDQLEACGDNFLKFNLLDCIVDHRWNQASDIR
jgi:dsRNA-specific ribonuclease